MVSTYPLLARKCEFIREAYNACTVYECRLVSDVHWGGFVDEARVDNIHVDILGVLFEQTKGDLDVLESVTKVGS